MIRNNTIISLLTLIGLCFAPALAQRGSHGVSAQVRLSKIAGNPAVFGSVYGRILDDSHSSASTGQGIGGTRIILRSIEQGSRIIGNYISDAAGSYKFENISPGEYTVEIDPISIPAKYHESVPIAFPVTVNASGTSSVDLPMSARRSITGVAFVDKNGDGQYQPQTDEPVAGVDIVIDSRLTTTDPRGRYSIADLPAGRVSLLATSPQNFRSTHVILDLPSAPILHQVFNIPVGR